MKLFYRVFFLWLFAFKVGSSQEINSIPYDLKPEHVIYQSIGGFGAGAFVSLLGIFVGASLENCDNVDNEGMLTLDFCGITGGVIGGTIGYQVGTSIGVFSIGDHQEKNGSYLATFLGSTLGGIVGTSISYYIAQNLESSSSYQFLVPTTFLIIPNLFTITAFNWSDKRHYRRKK